MQIGNPTLKPKLKTIKSLLYLFENKFGNLIIDSFENNVKIKPFYSTFTLFYYYQNFVKIG